jgi:hypothetical protein
MFHCIVIRYKYLCFLNYNIYGSLWIGNTSSNVYILATKILNKVVKEIGGSKPVYENASWYPSTVEYEVSFKIPSKNQADMVQIASSGLSPGGTNKDDACEAVARDIILSARCVLLLKKYIEGQQIMESMNKSCMVIRGICFASDIFVDKANEIDNLAKVPGSNPIMATIYRDCARKLQVIAQSSIMDPNFH